MGDIVSLKRHRKQKARIARDEQAAVNRAKFGQTKDERELAAALRRKSERDLDGHKK
jgi:hypothetical protein